MGLELENNPDYRSTMDRLEALKRQSEDGSDYWMARDIHVILQYRVWDKFEPVIGRATDAIRGNGIDPSHHIAQTSNMMEVGKGATIAAIAKAAGLSYSGAYKICAARAGRDKSQKTQVNVMLESHHVAAAQALGDGNITLGIKRAIERAAAVAQGETLFSGDEIREAVSRALADLTGRAKTKSPDA